MLFSHSKSRIEALSDGVFAFAATLMMVDLGASSEFISFSDELPNFISFGASFFIVMTLWKLHYNFFRRSKYIDNWIITLNIILLFTVLFYIFPVKSLLNSILQQKGMSFDDLSQLFLIYSLGFSTLFLNFVLLYYRAYKKNTKVENPYVLLFYARHFSLFVIVGIISAAMAYFEIGIQVGAPGFVFGILGLLCYLHSVRFQKKHPLF